MVLLVPRIGQSPALGRTLTFSCWNVNGWTEKNKELRTEIIKNIDSDIFFLNETHLVRQSNIEIPYL